MNPPLLQRKRRLLPSPLIPLLVVMPYNWYSSRSWEWCLFCGRLGDRKREWGDKGPQAQLASPHLSEELKSIQVFQMYTPFSHQYFSRFCPVETQPKVVAWKQVKEPLVTIQYCVPDSQKTVKKARKIWGKAVFFLCAFQFDISSGILFPSGKIQMIISLQELQREKNNNTLNLQPSSNLDYLCSRHSVLLCPKGTELILISSISTFKRGFIFLAFDWYLFFFFFFLFAELLQRLPWFSPEHVIWSPSSWSD